jgi:hypothetical protein
MSWWLRLLAAGILMLPLEARAQVRPAPDRASTPLVDDYMSIRGLSSYETVTLPPKDLVAAAFGTDYGRALVGAFGDILFASADKSCLQSRKLSRADVTRAAGEIYQRYGTRMFELSRSAFNTPAYEAALKARAPTLHADVARLRGDPDVQKLLALEQPTRFNGSAGLVVENLTLYLLIRGIKLTKDVWGLRGDTSLTNRAASEAAENARHQFVANSKSPQLKQHIALVKTLTQVRAASYDRAAAARLGPAQYFSGVEADLAGLCIPGIKQP